MVLQRWEPYRELRQMEDTMNRLWRGFGSWPYYHDGGEAWNIAVDVIQRPEEIVVKASLPGVKTEDIDVSVEDNILTLKAERKNELKEEKEGYLIQERSTGSYYRALRLPDTVDTAKIQSFYENGVLTVTLPQAEEKKKKQIQVKVGSAPKAIEATAKKK
jgi:HSP20 family protein